MEREHKLLLTIGGILLAGLLLAAGYLIADTIGLIAAAATILLAMMVVSAYYTGYIILNEMEVGVIFSRHGNFVCFLDNDYGRITPRPSGSTHYDGSNLPPKLTKPLRRHRINPAGEVLKSKMRKGSYKASGVSNDIRTKEGIPVTIPWSISFKVDALRILPGIEHKMARALPENAHKTVGGRVPQILQHIIGQKSIETVYTTLEGRGAIQSLEDEVRETLLAKTKSLGVYGIAAHDIKIGPIRLPQKIETTLRGSYERQLRTETAAKSLTMLREAISAFTPEDMQRLTELERLRIIDEKTKSMVLTESIVNSIKEKNIHFYEEASGKNNGRGHTDEPVSNQG